LNETLIVQLAFTVTGLVQLFVCMKSPGFAPLKPMFEMCNGPVPEFVTVSGWEALVLPTTVDEKLRLDGTSVTAGAGATPTPESAAECGLPAALSETVRDAARTPATEGVKVTLNVQLAPAASAAGQLFVCEKSTAFGPEIETPVMLSVAVPVLKS